MTRLTGFDPDALEYGLEPLEPLGRELWLPAIINSEGFLFDRIGELARWRQRLLAGQLPFDPDADWPNADAIATFGPACQSLGLHELTRSHDEITVQVMRSLMFHIDRIALAQGRVSRAEAVELATQAFVADWEAQGTELHEILRVFESLDGVQNFARFSELSGLLHSEAWQAILDAHAHVGGMSELTDMIRRLGRARPSQERTEKGAVHRHARRSERQWVRRTSWIDLPGAGNEVEGVRRSGDLARWLSSEALQLRPSRDRVGAARAKRLRRLFAARLAEQSLLTYQQRDQSLETHWVLAQAEQQVERPDPRPKLIAGPLILCVDTSSSMAGGPEVVAKAMVFEAMRVAHRERRACRVYAFSGPEDLRAHDLPMDVYGLLGLGSFLSQSFHGGTDIVAPIEAALDDVETAGWNNADIVIASDGEFGATRATLARLDAVKASQGLRVQGVLTGDRETMGLKRVADAVFWVRDWRRYGARHGQVESPVHDRNLTTLYFPNAR